MSSKGKSIQTKSRLMIALGVGERRMGLAANESVVSFWNDDNVLKLDSGDLCKTYEYTKKKKKNTAI